MKQLFCVVFALVVAIFLTACTSDNNDTTTTSTTLLQTTTSSHDSSITTTETTTTTTIVQAIQSTTDISDVVTTTTPVTTTSTTQKTDAPNGIVFYSQYPNVPDYGALVGVDYSKFENDIFYYRMDLVAQKDPSGNSGSRYMKLLEDCGYVALAPYDKDGVKGYLYGNSDTGSMVLFGAAPENGAIVVAIPQK